MRISDWSSDVCSSDLSERSPLPLGGGGCAGAGRREAANPAPRLAMLPDAGQEFRGLALQLQPRILMRLGAGERRDPLDEVEDRFRRAAFFLQHRGDDLLGHGAREAALAQEAIAIVVLARDELFESGPYTGKKRCDSGK